MRSPPIALTARVAAFLLLKRREGDVIGRVQGKRDIPFSRQRAKPSGGVAADPNPAAALVFKGIESELREIFGNLLRLFIAHRREAFGVSGGAEAGDAVHCGFLLS